VIEANCTSVMEYFEKTPRPQQLIALQEIDKHWNDYDVFVLNLPVAVGKSHLANAIAKWSGDSVILTPTNVLLDQYEKDFKDINYLRRKNMYPCNTNGCNNNKKCGAGKCLRMKLYKEAQSAFLKGDVRSCNYYMYIAMRKNYNFKHSTLIVDEAHNLIPTIGNFAAQKIWRSKWPYPNSVRSEMDLLEWAETQKFPRDIKKALKSIASEIPEYRFEKTTDYYRGQEEQLIKVKPVTIKSYRPLMWPWFVKKIVLLSATISHKDIEELGLDTRRVKYIETGSPIPPSSRSIIYSPVGSFNYKYQRGNIGKLAKAIQHYLSIFKSKGVIHTTYSMSRLLQEELDYEDRLIFHDSTNTREQYKKYLRSTDGVLVACGLSEGLDLHDDLGRWQLITKVPYPSLTDSAINYKALQDPKWYQWLAAKTIIQASGRVCRHQTDFGVTILLDKQFENLYNSNRELFPAWFQEALSINRKEM